MTKKLIIIFNLLFFITSPTFAKSQGHYVGVDLVGNSDIIQDIGDTLGSIFIEAATAGLADVDTGFSTSQSGSFGLNYKYAFNFLDTNYFHLFVAPGVFLDRNNFTVDQSSTITTLNYSYGTKVDLGIDLGSDKFFLSPFITLGLGAQDIDSTSSSDTCLTYIAGVGTRLNIDKVGITLGIEGSGNDNCKYTTMDGLLTGRLGLSYNF